MNRTLNPLRIDAHLAQAIPGPRRRDFVAGWFGLGGSGWVVRAGRFGLGTRFPSAKGAHHPSPGHRPGFQVRKIIPEGCKPELSSPCRNPSQSPPRATALATHGEIKGDTTTLEDSQVVAKLRESEEG